MVSPIPLIWRTEQDRRRATKGGVPWPHKLLKKTKEAKGQESEKKEWETQYDIHPKNLAQQRARLYQMYVCP
jgi:hypothetical protein